MVEGNIGFVGSVSRRGGVVGKEEGRVLLVGVVVSRMLEVNARSRERGVGGEQWGKKGKGMGSGRRCWSLVTVGCEAREGIRGGEVMAGEERWKGKKENIR